MEKASDFWQEVRSQATALNYQKVAVNGMNEDLLGVVYVTSQEKLFKLSITNCKECLSVDDLKLKKALEPGKTFQNRRCGFSMK